MFSTVKKENTTQIIFDRDRLAAPNKKQLLAQWHQVDGKLVCRWVKV